MNLSGYAAGGALGDDLGQELRVPTLPAYVAADSMELFGQTTFAGRLPFALCGVLSVGLIAVFCRRHFGRRFPCWLPALTMALSPAMLLYARNCRYYALGLMLTLVLLIFPARAVCGPAADARLGTCAAIWWRWLGAVWSLLLLINTNYLNAAVLIAVLPLTFLDRRYRQPRQYVLLALLLVAARLGRLVDRHNRQAVDGNL